MSQPKVVILLSTYNGEKYIKEQMESILNQEDCNIELLIRDDGSSDTTVGILQKYEKEYPNQVTLIQGENQGFVDSFFTLLQQAPKADYYAFSDQDDVWEKEKIKNAIAILEKQAKDIPVMYFSEYDFYDQDMKFLSHPQKRNKVISYQNSLIECVNAGMATLINETAREKILTHLPKKNSLGHDWWIYMVCQTFGKVVHDDRAMVRHRVHGSNTSKCGESFVKRYKRRIRTLFQNNHFQQLKKQLQEFFDCFEQELTVEQNQIVQSFLHPNNGLKTQMKKLFFPKRYKNILKEEIVFRMAIILNMI